jgi:hypothetical protein
VAFHVCSPAHWPYGVAHVTGAGVGPAVVGALVGLLVVGAVLVLVERTSAESKPVEQWTSTTASDARDCDSNNLHVSTVCANNVSYGIGAGSALQVSAGKSQC